MGGANTYLPSEFYIHIEIILEVRDSISFIVVSVVSPMVPDTQCRFSRYQNSLLVLKECEFLDPWVHVKFKNISGIRSPIHGKQRSLLRSVLHFIITDIYKVCTICQTSC